MPGPKQMGFKAVRDKSFNLPKSWIGTLFAQGSSRHVFAESMLSLGSMPCGIMTVTIRSSRSRLSFTAASTDTLERLVPSPER